jgi:hypothetical protein
MKTEIHIDEPLVLDAIPFEDVVLYGCETWSLILKTEGF